ncbi:MAG: DUF177 domain-containing protein [Bacteroidetes bacterium]|nr:DUF177 domain-containing protein [Bacteroidota bacterium]MBT6686465.1 DUF177 domain-containing protein [Bacteroidota bacterium]MBT7143572.1 DUF177 domain-containing protein [Bacteroidota bacterium]MBT7491370.1 DUF177 domain-containing protein [Bacteroidota bacterium]
MKKNDFYIVPFKGLKNGFHEFQFVIDETFFIDFDKSEVKEGKVDVKIVLEKNEQILIFDFYLNGYVKMECDFCLEPFDLPINFSSKFHVRFGMEVEDSRYIGEEIRVISADDYEIDISQNIYEYIHLNLPFKRIHPKDKEGKSQCNKEMIELIENMSNQTNSDNKTDPRWDKLKKLTIEN